MENMPSAPFENPEFARQKAQFFSDLALHLHPSMHLHREQGLWQRVINEDGERVRDWGNVTEHCLVEAARVAVLADLVELPDDVKKDLLLAAGVHDFYKKAEITLLRENNTSWDAYAKAQEEARQILEASELPDRVIYLATAVGHETVPYALDLVAKPMLTADETAWLLMHYVDDYTIDSEWVVPATDDTGGILNDLDRRMNLVKVNALPGGKYHGINRAGFEHFGEPTYDAQHRAGNQVQQRISELVSDHTGNTIEPKLLPETVDTIIAHKITDGLPAWS